MYSGWLFDAETTGLQVVQGMFSYQEIAELLDCRSVMCESFPTPDGTYYVWHNEDRYEQALYNQAAQWVLGRIPHPWKTFHGNFLVTYMIKVSGDNTHAKMPDVTVTEFVDACTRAKTV